MTTNREKTVASGVSPTPAADAKKDLQNYPFLVRVLITFTKMNDQSKEAKYKEEVIFKLDSASATMPWYVLRNYTVPKFLTKKYGPIEVAWQRIYEIKILKLINRTNPTDITDIPMRVMTIEQLAEYCRKWELGVDVHEFYSIEKAREMVALRQADEGGYKRHLAEYREGKQRSYPELDNMRGDKEAAVAEASEFEELEKQIPVTDVPKKVAPTEEVEPSAVEKELLSTGKPTGPTGPAVAAEAQPDPFAGV